MEGHRYRSSFLRALLTEALIVATGMILVVSWWYLYQAMVASLEDGDPDLGGRILDEARPVFIALPILVAATLVAYGAWISRVVDNLPALGAGYSRVSPRMAFLENVVPGVNLMRLPARVREVTLLLHPSGRGDNLIVAAWLAIYVGWAIFGAFYYLGARLFRVAVVSTRDFERSVVQLLGIPVTMTAIGLLVVIAVLYRVEKLADARARALKSPLAAPDTIPPDRPSPPRGQAGSR